MTFEMKMQEARNEGKEEGLAEGLAEGLTKMATTVAMNMLSKNEPIDKIAEYTGLTEEQIQELATKL